MATSVELPIHLPIFPPEERSFEATCDEHECTVWPCNSIWRSARHRFTPKVVKDLLASDRFQHRLQLWHLIHDLGSNTKARCETTKYLRSNEGGLTLCYVLRRLATSIQELYRTLALQAIDTTIVRWKGKPALEPLGFELRGLSVRIGRLPFGGFFDNGIFACWNTTYPCHVPSFKTIFIKHASLVGILCNHKSAVSSLGLRSPPRPAVANTGKNSKMQH